MMKPDKRFYPVNTISGGPGLIIEDFVWWADNEREIFNWMVDNLPRGIEHQEGMTISFETQQERLAFLLRWA